MKRYLFALLVLLPRLASAQTAYPYTFDQDGVAVTSYQTCVDTQPCVDVGLTKSVSFLLADGSHTISVNACNANGCTAGVPITSVFPVPLPTPVQVTVVSPAPGASFPLAQTSTTGFTAVVTAQDNSGIKSVTVSFGVAGAATPFICGQPATAFMSCTSSGGTYTFQIKTGLGPGPRVLSFAVVANDGDRLVTPQQAVLVTP